jgi:WD40 repeat protein
MPDGTTLVATGGDDATICLWDPLSGNAVGSPLTGEGASLWAVFSIAAISLPGRTMLAAVGGHRVGTVLLWDLAAALPAGTGVSGHGGGISSLAAVAVESGRTLLASAGRDQMVHLWDPRTGKAAGPPLKAEDDAGPAYSLVAVRGVDGRTLLASGWRDGSVRLWDPSTGTTAGAPLVGHRSAVSTLAALNLEHGRPLLASGDRAGMVRLWDLTTWTAVGDPYQGPGDLVRSVFVIQASGRTLLICNSDNHERLVCVWDITTRALVRQAPLGLNEFLIGILTPKLGRTLLVSGDADGTVRLSDPITGAYVGPGMIGHTGWVTSAAAVAIRGEQQWLVTASHDGTIRLWEPSTGAAVDEPLRGHIGFVTDMVAAPTAKGHIALASSGSDNTILLWSRRVADDRNVSL